MINVLIYIALFYLSVNLFGFLLKKIRIPGIYAALFLGIALGTNQDVINFTNIELIHLFTYTGIFLLLFLLGFNLNFDELRKQGRLIIKTTLFVIVSETFIGTFALHLLFNINWFLAGIISISFATVGEVALLPILKEFKLIKTKLGQIILGVSVLDDVVEIITFLFVIVYIGSFQTSEIIKEIIPIIAIFLGVFIKRMIKNKVKIDKIINVLALSVFGPFFFFLRAPKQISTLFLINSY